MSTVCGAAGMVVASCIVTAISLCVTAICVTHSSHLPASTLHDVLSAAEWDSLLLLCDVRSSECPAEDVLSVRPAVYVSMDLTNRSLIVQMFEKHAAPKQLNWLVFCAHCETLMIEINAFEDTHDLHGYFTHRYQWILVPDDDSNLNLIQEHTGKVFHLAVLSSSSIYTAMYGRKRYLQQIYHTAQITRNTDANNTYMFPNEGNE